MSPWRSWVKNCPGPNCAYEDLYRSKLDLTIFTQLLLGFIASQVRGYNNGEEGGREALILCSLTH